MMKIALPPILVALLTVIFSTISYVQGFAAGFQKKPTKAALKKKNLPNLPYVVDESPSITQLVKYLVDVEECEGIESLVVGTGISTNLRGLFAKESFREGEYICAIPFVSTVLLDETFFSKSDPQEEDEAQLASYRVENAIRFLRRIVKIEMSDATSLESMYRESLPLSNEDTAFSPTPDFWTEENIKQLQVPSIVQDLLERKELVRSRVQRSDNNEDMDITESELRHALWVVRSRAFTTLKEAIDLDGTEGLLQRTVMVPFLDFLNHQRVPNAALEVVEAKAYEESFYALVATRSIRKGEEVTICYGTGDEASWDLYTQYGFWPDGHEDNDCQQLPEVTEWTTTLEQDLEQRNAISIEEDRASVTRAILDFRIRIKQAERNRSIGT